MTSWNPPLPNGGWNPLQDHDVAAISRRSDGPSSVSDLVPWQTPVMIRSGGPFYSVSWGSFIIHGMNGIPVSLKPCAPYHGIRRAFEDFEEHLFLWFSLRHSAVFKLLPLACARISWALEEISAPGLGGLGGLLGGLWECHSEWC